MQTSSPVNQPSPTFTSTGTPLRKPRYRWLLFDADGTLFDYDRAEAAALAKVFELNRLPFNSACVPIYREVNQALWLELEKRLVTPDALKVRRFEVLLRRLGIDHPATNFSDLYLECLAGCSELVDGAQEVLETLSSSCRFAIVTNGLKAVQRSRVERSAIRDLVSEISEEIGHAKPGCEFFQVAFERLGHPSKTEVLLVGDSWSSDIQGAANYGIDACWYNPGRKPRPEAPTISCEIASLRELVGLVIG